MTPANLPNKEWGLLHKTRKTPAMGNNQVRNLVLSTVLVCLSTACSNHHGTPETSQAEESPSEKLYLDQLAMQKLSKEDLALVEKSAMKASCKQFARRVLTSVQDGTTDANNTPERKDVNKQFQSELRDTLARDASATPPKQYDEAACKKANEDWTYISANNDEIKARRIDYSGAEMMFDKPWKEGLLKDSYIITDDGAKAAAVASPVSASPTPDAASPASSPTGAQNQVSDGQPTEKAVAVAQPTSANDLVCTTPSDCFQSLLSAASLENEAAANTVASTFGTMTKPPRGDRQQARAANGRGLAALKDGRYDVAQEEFAKATAADADDVEAISNLAFTYTQLGNWDRAETLGVAALALDPRRTSTWAPLAVALAKNGKSNQALEALWLAYAFSSNKQKTLDFISSKADSVGDPIVKDMYRKSYSWLAQTQKPSFN
jgi:tetratricopeptide (TPR) repeat protein